MFAIGILRVPLRRGWTFAVIGQGGPLALLPVTKYCGQVL